MIFQLVKVQVRGVAKYLLDFFANLSAANKMLLISVC